MYVAQEVSVSIPVHISVLNSVVSRSASLLAPALSCFSAVVHTVFQSSSSLANTPTGYNALFW